MVVPATAAAMAEEMAMAEGEELVAVVVRERFNLPWWERKARGTRSAYGADGYSMKRV